MLRVTDLQAQKSGKQILKGVSFDVAQGEILTVLGPSGAGKSTLLRCLNRLEPWAGGQILLGETNTGDMDVLELRRKVGMVFQVPSLIPFSVCENIRLGPEMRGENLEDAQCEYLLNQVGLGKEYLHREVESLSVGEQQRVAFAQALANKPEVLLLDEPTSALDPTAVLTIENRIKHIRKEMNIGIVMVTHDVPQALRFDAQTIVMIDGEIIAQGNIQELMQNSSDERLKQFFEGRLTAGGGEIQAPL